MVSSNSSALSFKQPPDAPKMYALDVRLEFGDRTILWARTFDDFLISVEVGLEATVALMLFITCIAEDTFKANQTQATRETGEFIELQLRCDKDPNTILAVRESPERVGDLLLEFETEDEFLPVVVPGDTALTWAHLLNSHARKLLEFERICQEVPACSLPPSSARLQ